MTITTNAQTFSRPEMTNGTLDIYVGAPHTTTNGNQHDGFYRAFIPNAQLDRWNISDPETELAAKYQGDAASFEVNDTPAGGAWINLDVHYSDGYVEVGSTENVTVEGSDPPKFTTAIAGTNAPVADGDSLDVDVTVENTGDQQDTQTVTMDANGSQQDNTTVTLNAGQQTTVTLSWSTSAGDTGTFTTDVASDNDTASTSVEVGSSPSFEVTSLSTNSAVTAGELLTVDATVENIGDKNGTQTVSLDVDGEGNSTELFLENDTSETVTLAWNTTAGDAGDYTANVLTANTSANTGVSVDAQANFDVSGVSTNAPVTEGETLTVNATVENTGDVPDTQTVALDTNGTQRVSTSQQLDSGESTTVSLSWDTASGDNGTYNAAIVTDDDSASVTADVETASSGSGGGGGIGGIGGGDGDDSSDSTTSLTIDSVTSPVAVGDTVDVTATVTNNGNESVERGLELRAAGQSQDSTFVLVGGGSSKTATLSFEVTEEMADTSITVTVATDANEASATVEVESVEGTAETDEGTETGNQTEADSETDTQQGRDGGGGDGLPGFGPLAALAALLISVVALRRQQ